MYRINYNYLRPKKAQWLKRMYDTPFALRQDLEGGLVTGAVISVTGLISFVGLLAPHIARLLTGSSRFSTTVLSGLCGSILLLLADVLARSIGGSEVPISTAQTPPSPSAALP